MHTLHYVYYVFFLVGIFVLYTGAIGFGWAYARARLDRPV